MTTKLPTPCYVKADAELQRIAAHLQEEPLIAVDTESNNMYAYKGQVCLVQVSTRDTDYIIDPLAIEDMQPFGDLLSNPDIEKIFHAAEYDLICMQRDFGFSVENLFDTMYAARLCHVEKFGLSDLLQQTFGIELDKSHQTDDWGRRPLSKDSLKYAQRDTHFLPRLRDKMLEQLRELDRLEEAQEVFLDVLRIEAKDDGFDPDGYWKLGRPNRLRKRQMALLKEVYLLREELAEELDLPPFKVLSNKALVELAEKQPRNLTELFNIRGMSARYLRMFGDDILDALERGAKAKPPHPPRNDMPDASLLERYAVLHSWRKERAIARNLGSSLVLSKSTLWELAAELPKTREELAQIEGIGTWRLATYGDELLELIDTLRR